MRNLSHRPPRIWMNFGWVLMLVPLLVTATGCPPPVARTPFTPLAMPEAIRQVNANAVGTDVTIQAVGGHARGHITDIDGKKHRFDLDAHLLVRRPRHMRLDLTALGKSQMLFGSSRQRYWVVVRAKIDTLWWGRHDATTGRSERELLLRPDLIVEVFGFAPLDEQTTGPNGLVQRITEDHQQLLFIDHDDQSRGLITREYWLDGYRPGLIDRILFRDALGRTIMDARLDDHKRIAENGPIVAHRIEVFWPTADSRMVFTARGWRLLPNIDESHPGFAFPLDLGDSFKRVVDIDAKLDAERPPGVS